jgi:AraC-like DNA-binding protein
MDIQSGNRKRLARLLDEVAVEEGIQQTQVEGVLVIRHTEPRPRTPTVYEPAIVVIGQGQKRGYLGDEVYVYDQFNYLVLSVPLPVECEWEASPENPLLLVAVSVELTMLGELLLEMDEQLLPVSPMPRGISTAQMTEELSGAVIRLVECLKCPLDSRMLGRQIVREIVYRVLCSKEGGSLRALASRDEHFIRIARVLKDIHTDCAKPFSVDSMARRAGMSVAAFHNNFKLVTASSPLQYLKRMRLDRAKRLMVHDGYNASTAARAVGYESPSQFSREYRRLFGAPPLEEIELTRDRLVSD